MKKLGRAISLILTAALLCSTAAGCSHPSANMASAQPGSGTSSAEQATGGSITANIQTEPAQLNSMLTYDIPSMDILLAVEEGLTRLDKSNNIIPGIAEKWDISDDKLTYTFHLRDADWSDGSKVTAGDFAFAWLTLLDKDSGASDISLFYPIKGAKDYNEGKIEKDAVGIKATDEKTLQVTLANPTPYFLGLCAQGNFLPVNQKFYESLGKGKDNTYGTDVEKLLYNGPWKMTQWLHNNKIVLTKNDAYYNSSEIKLNEINLAMVSDPGTAYNMFSTGQLDTTELSGGDQIQMAKASDYDVQTFDSGATTYIAFNTTNAVMKNANIRKAFSYAVDRESFVKNVLKNGSIAAYSLTNPVVKGLNGSFQQEISSKFKQPSTSEAKSYLEKGMKELGLTEMPKVTFLIDDRASIKTQSAVYQEYWKKNLGVDVEVESMPYKAKLAKQNAKDFMMTISGWESSYDDPLVFMELFVSGDANNTSLYSNPKFDDLVEQAKEAEDSEKHYELLEQAELLLMDDAPLAPLYYSFTSYLVQPKLKGFYRSSFYDMNFYYANLSE